MKYFVVDYNNRTIAETQSLRCATKMKNDFNAFTKNSNGAKIVSAVKI